MKCAFPIFAGAAVLALANVALAEEASLSTADHPILLTDAQMDSVTAGSAGFSASINNGSGNLFVNFASAQQQQGVSASSFIDVTFSTNSFVEGSVSAFADTF